MPEEPDTEPKKLDWIMTPELKLAVVSLHRPFVFYVSYADTSDTQRFAETRLADLICQNEAVALEFEVYGKNAITRLFLSLAPNHRRTIAD